MGEISLYRDNQVEVDFPVSKVLTDLMAEADKFYEAGDWFWYDIRCSEIESSSKQDLISGLLSKESFDKIWQRYGLS